MVVKLEKAKRKFVLLPKRWVVKRSFDWAGRFRSWPMTTNGYRPPSLVSIGSLSLPSCLTPSSAKVQKHALVCSLRNLPKLDQ